MTPHLRDWGSWYTRTAGVTAFGTPGPSREFGEENDLWGRYGAQVACFYARQQAAMSFGHNRRWAQSNMAEWPTPHTGAPWNALEPPWCAHGTYGCFGPFWRAGGQGGPIWVQIGRVHAPTLKRWPTMQSAPEICMTNLSQFLTCLSS